MKIFIVFQFIFRRLKNSYCIATKMDISNIYDNKKHYIDPVLFAERQTGHNQMVKVYDKTI